MPKHHRPSWSKFGYLIVLFLLGLGLILAWPWLISAWQRWQMRPTIAPLPQDALVQAYFNHNLASNYREPYRQKIRPGDNLEQIILEAIAQAQSSIDVAVQEFRLPRIAQALGAKHKAGVAVRVILENTYSRPWSEFTPAEVAALDERDQGRYQEFIALVDQNRDQKISPEEIAQGDALVILRNAQVPWLDDTADGSKGSGLMHHKFMVIDQQTTIVTSANWTTSDMHGDFASPDSRGNANNLLKISDPQLASIFNQEFNLMWGDGPGGQNDSVFGTKKPQRQPQTLQIGNNQITVHFSPSSRKIPWAQTSNGLISQVLSQANQRIDLALFVFSEQNLANTLQTQQQAGRQVQVLIDRRFAYRSYSEGLDLLGVALAEQCRYEAGNQPWAQPIQAVGIPDLPSGDALHHKFAVLDQSTVITGSHNWSEAANSQNDEVVIVIQNPTVAAHFQREFDRLFKTAILGIPPELQAEIDQQKQTCPPPKSPIINLNTATAKEIATLPGIGPKLAERIVAARPLRSQADLMAVPGMNPKILQQITGKATW